MSTRLSLSLLLGAFAFATACNAHDLKAVERDILVVDVGISIPIPPPSLTSEPVQDVDLEGAVADRQADSQEELTADVVLHEVVSGSEYTVVARPDGTFDFSAVRVDFDNNCIEVFAQYEDDFGLQRGVSSFYRAVIAEDDMSGWLDSRDSCDDVD